MTLENRRKWLAHYRKVGRQDLVDDMLKKYPDTEEPEKKKEPEKKEKVKKS